MLIVLPRIPAPRHAWPPRSTRPVQGSKTSARSSERGSANRVPVQTVGERAPTCGVRQKARCRRNCHRMSQVWPAISKRICSIHVVSAWQLASKTGQLPMRSAWLSESTIPASSTRKLCLRNTTITETVGSLATTTDSCGTVAAGDGAATAFRVAITGSRIASSAADVAKLGAIQEEVANGATGADAEFSCRTIGRSLATSGASGVDFALVRAANSSRSWNSWSDDQSRPNKTVTAASRNSRALVRGNPWFVEVSIRPTQSVVVSPATQMSLVSESRLRLFRRRQRRRDGARIRAGNDRL